MTLAADDTKRRQLHESADILFRVSKHSDNSNVNLRRFKPYPAYKDSGIEWLGEIPTHWEVAPVKRRAERIQTGSRPPTEALHYYENGRIPWFGPGSFGNNLILSEPVKLIAQAAVDAGVARMFSAGSTMIVTIGATIGKVGYIENPGSSNQQITGVTFDTTKVHSKFAAYQLKRLEPVLQGIAPSTTLPIFDQSEVGYLPFALPPLSEQEAISDLLNREIAKIDALVENKERLIELLQEKRAALITRAVTKGLDPNIPMKDSGVEWLGEIPAHWEIKKKGTTPTTLGSQFLDQGIRFIKAENIDNGKVSDEPATFIDSATDELLRRSRLESQDVLMVIAGATTGKKWNHRRNPDSC